MLLKVMIRHDKLDLKCETAKISCGRKDHFKDFRKKTPLVMWSDFLV